MPSPTPTHPATGSPVPAVLQRGYGGTEVLELGERPLPVVGAGDVLVEVHAAAIDRGTWHLMTGTPTMVRLALGLRRPRTQVPGRDLAGVVVAVGHAVDGFAVGDRVHGTADGSLTTHALTTPDRLAHVPDGCALDEAAAVPVSGLTAYQALVEVAEVIAGQRVLVTGASGGVGTFAVQLAATLGAAVTASARPDAHDRLRALGATHVLDRTTGDPYLSADADSFDVVVDLAGRPPLRRLRRVLRRGGTAVIVGGEGGTTTVGGMSRQLRAVAVSPLVPERLAVLVSKERGDHLARLDEWWAAGRMHPVIDSTFGLDEVPAAMDRLTSGDVFGKVVVHLR